MAMRQPERLLALLLAAACGAFLALKFALLGRSNINWDEFIYLSNVYQATRGELTFFLQGAYWHLFAWLTAWPGDEIDQIVVARVLMMFLLVGSMVLLWVLSGRWLTGIPRWIPLLVFVSSWPVLRHGASFRADSMLVFLLLAGLVLLTARRRKRAADYAAGAVFGAAFVLTVKTILFAPIVIVLLLWRETPPKDAMQDPGSDRWHRLLRVALASSVVAVVLLGLHWTTLPAVPPEVHVSQGSRTFTRMLLDVPWFPRGAVLESLYRLQPLGWVLIAVGALLALARRRLDLAAMALALLPIVFYRNAFPYFFVVMLAPATILAGFALQEVVGSVSGRFGRMAGLVLVVAVSFGLLRQGQAAASWIDWEGQASQRELIAAIHEIFPEPVNYVDRCGMVSSFRKANFFMSTWGMEVYREQGSPFMSRSMDRQRPAFVLVNTDALDAGRRSPRGLLPEDYDLIEQFYQPYWGPVRVAGAQATLGDSAVSSVRVPFPGEYRLESDRPIIIGEMEYEPGEVVGIDTEWVSMRVADAPSGGSVTVRLVLDAARPPPARKFSGKPLFEPL